MPHFKSKISDLVLCSEFNLFCINEFDEFNCIAIYTQMKFFLNLQKIDQSYNNFVEF
jgi:hypothetical protein